MVKVELDVEEAWAIFNQIVNQMLEEVELDKSDRAAIRRWKSSEMRPGREEMEELHEKINDDVERLWDVRRKSELRRPDWR